MLSVAAFLLFYNLDTTPRTWHDEGGALSLARTLTEDGVYGIRNEGDYQTFGALQSVGPTVILPIILSFKLFGVGLLQGRAVTSVYALLLLVCVYLVGARLAGRRTGLVAALLLSGVGSLFLHNGRQALAEIPATALFLGGWLLWVRAQERGRRSLCGAAGLLFGLAMVTKLQIAAIGLASIAVLIVLDLLYFRQRSWPGLLAAGAVASIVVGAWQMWQLLSFGPEMYQENAAKLRALAQVTVGFRPSWIVTSLQYLLGTSADHLYFFWGFPALVYCAARCVRRSRESVALALLVIVTALWFTYAVMLQVPFEVYLLGPILLTSIFVARLWHDLTNGFHVDWPGLRVELQSRHAGTALARAALVAALAMMIGQPLQKAVRSEVLARDTTQQQLVSLINAQIPESSVIETWDRELMVLTDHRYHFPDEALLISSHAANYLAAPRQYALGAEYFDIHRPAYVIIGQWWPARFADNYDMRYLARSSCLLASVGAGDGRYDIYRLQAGATSGSALEDDTVAPCNS